jgi:hypothetical protein
MHGPRKKWKPRIALLVLAMGLTATAHLLAAMVGVAAAAVLMMYLAERRRSYVLQILVFGSLGALGIVFASFAFHLQPFTYVFTGGSARLWFSLRGAEAFFSALENLPIAVAAGVSLVLWAGVRRSRYFGNTAPLVMALVLLPIVTTQTVTNPVLWALPFLLTFIGGVFADALETRQRRTFLLLTGGVLLTQALVCLASLPGIPRL